MMLSRNALNSVKGFDEDYFMYGEDIDLSYRIKKAGFINYYLGELTIIHHKGSSSSTNKALATKHFYDAMGVFVNKYYNKSRFQKMTLSMGIECIRKFVMLKGRIDSLFKTSRSNDSANR